MARDSLTAKELELDLVATLSEAIFGHGHAHYGYFREARADDLTAAALGRAQEAYLAELAGVLPEGAVSILDVGSGAGANARALTERGYVVDCVSPSPHMNALARAKLPDSVTVHTTTFEAFRTDRRYDALIFAESFHYIPVDAALARAAELGAPHMVIFDYFRRGPEDKAGTYPAFRAALARQGVFRADVDRDVTDHILPTFEILDRLGNEYLRPFAARARGRLRAAYPVRMWLAEAALARPLRKLSQPARRAENFARRFEYRLIRLARD
jgi:SAM-dependent methyltransferase